MIDKRLPRALGYAMLVYFRGTAAGEAMTICSPWVGVI